MIFLCPLSAHAMRNSTDKRVTEFLKAAIHKVKKSRLLHNLGVYLGGEPTIPVLLVLVY
jgi:hypothetical protein